MASSAKYKHPKVFPPGSGKGRARNNSSKTRTGNSLDSAIQDDLAPGIGGLDGELQNVVEDGLELTLEPGTRASNLLALQRTLGNRIVQRILQRKGPDDASAPGGASPDPDAGLPDDLRAFRAKGPTPSDEAGTTVVPSTGMGGFNARYDPKTMVLTIKLNIGMNFLDGMLINGNRVTATEDSMRPSAIQINRILGRLSGEKRAKALDQVREQWTWTGASDPRITAWMAAYRGNVTSVWSSSGSGIVFQGSRKGWESQLAKVNVVVNTQNITSLAPGTPIPGPKPVHCQANIFKTPDADVFGANVAPGSPTSGTDQFLSLGSGQVTAQSHLLTHSVFFANNSSTLNSKARETLRKWIISFQATPGTPGDSISITGHANTKGEKTEAGRERNLELSLERAASVEKFLKTTAVEGSLLRNATTRIGAIVGVGAGGAGEGAEWRRVTIVVGSGQGQNIAAHEFGHMLGLGDEYASTPKRDKSGKIVKDTEGNEVTRGLISGTGGDVGTPTAHNKLAGEMGLGGSVHENNDNIMSLGSTVRPQHYATFMLALHNVTGINDWKVKV
jgi:outer membrane protein OmpA-like peptidoglycan-associated protein